MSWIDRILWWLVVPRGRRVSQRDKAAAGGSRLVYELKGALLSWLVRRDLQGRSHKKDPVSTMGERFRLGRPLAPPRLTREQAIDSALAVLSPQLFDHPFTVKYGSCWCDEEPIGTRDVWKITISGLRLPYPGGRRGGTKAPIRYMSTFIIIVDDKLGAYREATGY